MKKPADLPKTTAVTDIQTKLKDKLQNGVKDVVQKTNKRISNAGPPGPKSAEVDEVDEIYKEEDPIGVSIDIRKKAGNISSTVAEKNSKSGKFFFTLRSKGDAIPITDHARKAVAIAEGKTDAAGNVIEDEKPKPDPVDKAI